MKALRLYLTLIGGLLFLQGVAVLLVMYFSISLSSPWSRALRPDALHAGIHIVWGLLIGLGLKAHRAWALGLGLGLFYVLFAVLGIGLDSPLGLMLGRGENGFHLGVGAIALFLVLPQRRNKPQP